MHDLSFTLVAIATPPGRGGVGCIRISGPEAERVAEALFEAAGARSGDAPRFGRFKGRDGRAIDHGYLVLFPPGGSYTGELTAELWPHGSPAVLAELVHAAVSAGARPAGPGEFTYRALVHGRLDLARAEAVRDLVAARTLYQARVAFAQTEGALSRRLAPLRDGLADLISRGEAAVEFVEESETHLPPGELEHSIERAAAACRELLSGFREGRLVREGAVLVITGPPNAGKSSLFNRLLARERAIVTEMPGTTRDTLEEHLDLEGIPVRLVDTAGLREVEDPAEGEGVRRARAAKEEADMVLYLLDGSEPVGRQKREELASLESLAERGLVVVNKADLPGVMESALPCPDAMLVSARTGQGLEELRRAIRRSLLGSGPLEDPVLTDARHGLAVRQAYEALERAAGAAASGRSEEIVLEDLREAMDRVGSITGEFTREDLYDRIFSTFCIGK